MQHPRTTDRRAFSLIELLVVIAAIGILFAISVPVVGKVRDSAAFSLNRSNVRQWTVASLLHAADKGGYLPSVGRGSGFGLVDISLVTPHGPAGVLPWWNALPPYINEQPLADRFINDAAQNYGMPRLGQQSVWISPLARPQEGLQEWRSIMCYSPTRWSNPVGSATEFSLNIRDVRLPALTVMFTERPTFTQALGPSGNPFTDTGQTFATPLPLGRYNRNGTATLYGGLGGRVALGMFDGSVRVYLGREIAPGGGEVTLTQTQQTNFERGQNPLGLVWRFD